jgi:hypothetical protein
MSGIEDESSTERDLAEYFRTEVFADQPKSVGEALAAEEAEQPPPAPAEEIPEPPIEEPPMRVVDEPTQPVDTPTGQLEVPVAAEPLAEPEEEPELEDTEEDENVVWAKKKYGDAPEKWAKAAFDMERHITAISREKQEAEALAVQWYQYAQEVENEAQRTQATQLPMTAAEEQWVEAAMADPLGYARAAAFNGNTQLYTAVLGRIAEVNPQAAGQVGAQVQMELQQLASEQQPEPNGQPFQLPVALAESFQRLGISLEQHGPAISDKVGELGEYHPYVQAILGSNEGARDMAIQAVFDLVRAGTLTTRRVRDDARAEQIRREGELRREAAGVVSGSPHQPATQQDPFLQAMEDEWVARGQWSR